MNLKIYLVSKVSRLNHFFSLGGAKLFSAQGAFLLAIYILTVTKVSTLPALPQPSSLFLVSAKNPRSPV